MEVPKERFAHLIKKATSINETITQALADEFKVSVGTLERWAEGESLPPEEIRVHVLQRVTAIMLQTLGHITDMLKK